MHEIALPTEQPHKRMFSYIYIYIYIYTHTHTIKFFLIGCTTNSLDIQMSEE